MRLHRAPSTFMIHISLDLSSCCCLHFDIFVCFYAFDNCCLQTEDLLHICRTRLVILNGICHTELDGAMLNLTKAYAFPMFKWRSQRLHMIKPSSACLLWLILSSWHHLEDVPQSHMMYLPRDLYHRHQSETLVWPTYYCQGLV